VQRVGIHRERLNNLYFAFLFVVRAVSRAAPYLSAYSYETGDAAQDKHVADLMKKLVETVLPQEFALAQSLLLNLNETASAQAQNRSKAEAVNERTAESPQQRRAESGADDDVLQCRTGFDERQLFQVHSSEGLSYSAALQESVQLQETFRTRFRNITRIMDCVACDKCRVWGKLQILGFGTSIKLLLTPEEGLAQALAAQIAQQNLHKRGVRPPRPPPPPLLTRQEIIALINLLHQLTVSVRFAAKASEVELDAKLIDVRDRVTHAGAAAVIILLPLGLLGLAWRRRKQRLSAALS
jgi:ERO1-like protein alpha